MTKRETLAHLRAERDDARRWAVRLDGLRVEADAMIRSAGILLERAVADRDTALQRLSSCAAEVGAYRAQRDEAIAATADVLGIVGEQTLLYPSVDGPKIGRARQPVERYRRVVPSDAHKTG